MELVPFSWDVVAVGAWNRGILTPAGIAKYLLGLPDNTPVEVEVSMDVMGLFRVRHGGCVIVVDDRMVRVEAIAGDTASLAKAMEICRRGMERLPETPMGAVGFNIRYRVGAPSDYFLELLSGEVDERISDAGFHIKKRDTRRTLAYEDGRINLIVREEDDGEYVVIMNFERQSDNRNSLTSWLKLDAAAIESAVDRLRQILGGEEPK